MLLRIRFVKLGKVRWTSHRDVARMWERAFRRVGLPLAYSEGFSPRPKVSFGLALPTGHESLAEYLDVHVAAGTTIASGKLLAQLSEALPAGVDAVAAAEIEPGAPSLQQDVTSCTWRWQVANPVDSVSPPGLDQRVAAVRDASSVVVARHRKGTAVREDIRPSILDLQLASDGWLTAELAAQPRSIRPADVVAALGPELEERAVRRVHQWISRFGARREPVELPRPATSAAHAMERAS